MEKNRIMRVAPVIARVRRERWRRLAHVLVACAVLSVLIAAGLPPFD
jgi:hypothetical protein